MSAGVRAARSHESIGENLCRLVLSLDGALGLGLKRDSHIGMT